MNFLFLLKTNKVQNITRTLFPRKKKKKERNYYRRLNFKFLDRTNKNLFFSHLSTIHHPSTKKTVQVKKQMNKNLSRILYEKRTRNITKKGIILLPFRYYTLDIASSCTMEARRE